MAAAEDRPDWVKCIEKVRGRSWCGKRGASFFFVGLQHAAHNGARGGRMVACSQCVDAAMKALRAGATATQSDYELLYRGAMRLLKAERAQRRIEQGMEVGAQAVQEAWERERSDADALLRHLGLYPDDCRMVGGWLNLRRIRSLVGYAMGERPRWRHVKTGGTYLELGRGRLQVPGDVDLDLEPAVVYQSETDGLVRIRPVSEFEDGRFERVEQATGDAS